MIDTKTILELGQEGQDRRGAVINKKQDEDKAKWQPVNKKLDEWLSRDKDLGTDEIAFRYGYNFNVKPPEWVEWLRILGLSESDVKKIADTHFRILEEATVSEKLFSFANLASLDSKAEKYFKPAKDILRENISSPLYHEDRVRLCVFLHILGANKIVRVENQWQDEFDNKIQDKIAEINRLLGQQDMTEPRAEIVVDDGVDLTYSETSITPKSQVKRPKFEHAETKKWKSKSWEIGKEWFDQEPKKDKYPGVDDVAKYVEAKLKEQDIRGRRGDYLDWQTIKREALKGITGRPANGKC
ncbi:MAG: hypothetical protein WC856_22710 [Methylococcaceae bacterium]|jgi:hypothetical protein